MYDNWVYGAIILIVFGIWRLALWLDAGNIS